MITSVVNLIAGIIAATFTRGDDDNEFHVGELPHGVRFKTLRSGRFWECILKAVGVTADGAECECVVVVCVRVRVS